MIAMWFVSLRLLLEMLMTIIRKIKWNTDIEVPADPRLKHSDKDRESRQYLHPPTDVLQDIDSNGAMFLRTNWQIQGFLQEQADAIER